MYSWVCPHSRIAHTPTSPTPAYVPTWTRQAATAFNQQLSFNTSSVGDMNNMFFVRAMRALPHIWLGLFRMLLRRTNTSPPHGRPFLGSKRVLTSR